MLGSGALCVSDIAGLRSTGGDKEGAGACPGAGNEQEVKKK